jgi:hypothetical protein
MSGDTAVVREALTTRGVRLGGCMPALSYHCNAASQLAW